MNESSVNIDSVDPAVRKLSGAFQDAAQQVFASACPLYEHLARFVAGNGELLDLAAHARPGQEPSLILFDAVHYLLLRETTHPLSRYFISLTDPPAPPEDAAPVFAEFCRQHREELLLLLPSRTVQTNEVLRCALLLPAFGLAARAAKGAPLAVVALGASAGLNLEFDRYGYDYGDGLRGGDLTSPVQLSCRWIGPLRPPLPAGMPRIATRMGIDLNPVDLRDGDNLLWLLGQIWPDERYRSRAARLRAAAAIEAIDPPKLIAGDVIQALPEAVAAVPSDQAVCLLHSFTVYEMPADVRGRLNDVIAQCAATRPMLHVSLEWDSHHVTWLDLAIHSPNGQVETRRLAECHVHGEWMRWLAPADGEA
jgi:hypothetical protein